jgi:EpsI family protein
VSTTIRFVVVYLLLTAAALYLSLHTDLPVPVKRPFSEFPDQIGSWRMTSGSEFSADVLGVLKPTDYLYRQYRESGGRKVTFYIGYHGGGKDSGEIHSPRHCLPGSGWYEVSTQRRYLDVAGSRVNLVQSVYQKGMGKELFLYWFQVRDRTMNEEYSLKLAEIAGSLFYRRRDSSFIRISVPFEGDERAALKLGETFIRDFRPTILEFLPR